MSPRPTLDEAYELLRQGKLTDAEAACHAVLTRDAQDANAWCMLGMVFRAQQRSQDAESAYKRAMAIAPNNVTAHHNLGALYAQLDRAEEALALLDRARTLGLRARELSINRGRSLMLLYRFEESEREYAEAVAAQPSDSAAQVSLAQLRYMRGDPDFARDLIKGAASNPNDVRLHMALADIMRRAGSLQESERVLRDVLARKGPMPEVRGALSTLLHEAGRLKEAEVEALAAAVAQPTNIALIESVVSVQLSLGKPKETLPSISTQRRLRPHDQRWIAYEATAARLLGDARYGELYDYDRLVQVFDISTPAGWSSIEELNAAVIESLKQRHRFASHPLDQSLRNGTQTARSLTKDPDPAIQALLRAFAEPLENYRQIIGASAAHPLSARNRGPAVIVGSWSVQLRREGFHVNHIHPEGWISSAYYVSVPSETEAATRRSGWIKFGEPRFPIPGAVPERFVQPRAGRLVLFPSYLWHGTNAIHGPEPRTTIAFDAVPTATR